MRALAVCRRTLIEGLKRAKAEDGRKVLTFPKDAVQTASIVLGRA